LPSVSVSMGTITTHNNCELSSPQPASLRYVQLETCTSTLSIRMYAPQDPCFLFVHEIRLWTRYDLTLRVQKLSDCAIIRVLVSPQEYPHLVLDKDPVSRVIVKETPLNEVSLFEPIH